MHKPEIFLDDCWQTHYHATPALKTLKGVRQFCRAAVNLAGASQVSVDSEAWIQRVCDVGVSCLIVCRQFSSWMMS